ncbi:MAG: AAA family ATPase [Pontiellaceae bacterium]|nr:AAA family ATPase [Pontiellaceae bacterium]
MIYVEGDCCKDYLRYLPNKANKRKVTSIPSSVVDFLNQTWNAESDLNDSSTKNLNCSFYQAIETKQPHLSSGANLTAQFIASILEGHDVSLPGSLIEYMGVEPDSFVNLEPFKKDPDDDQSKDEVWRVSEYGGYSKKKEVKDSEINSESFQKINPSKDLLVIDDGGNGFRGQTELGNALDALLGRGGRVLIKLSRPLSKTGYLCELLEKRAANRKGLLVIVIDVRDLRSEGLDISRGLSWERTAGDFASSILNDPRASCLLAADYIVTRTDLEGAIICDVQRATDKANFQEHAFRLIYDPVAIEGDTDDQVAGHMVGFASVFSARIAAAISQNNPAKEDLMQSLQEACRAGLVDVRRLLIEGFGPSSAEPVIPTSIPEEQAKGKIPKLLLRKFFSVAVKRTATTGGVTCSSLSEQPCGWRILGELDSVYIARIAESIVTHGRNPEYYGIPVGRFGAVRIADRFELEGYRAVRGLMREYLEVPSPSGPLCVAVFGQPGCGKSFGVKQVAQAVFGKKPKVLTFNLSEFTGLSELTRAFHLVNDATREGTVPLVFFDEFDSKLGAEELGWLKYFLAPMQDGEFRDGGDLHPIGKAIFVFAGGTKHSFEEFNVAEGAGAQAFRSHKGPDFLSRLRGFINVSGPDYRFPSDFGAMIRRALVLRFNIVNRQKVLGIDPAQHMRSTDAGDVAIDPFLLKALLRVPRFKHGMRSISAILEMSRLSVVHGLEPSALPSREQLNLHVEANMLLSLMDAYRTIHSGVDDPELKVWDNMAKGAQWYYGFGQFFDERKDNDEKEKHNPASLTSLAMTFGPDGDAKKGTRYWDSNIRQVAEIPRRMISCGYHLVDKNAAHVGHSQVMGFTPEEIINMAREEHLRWITEKETQGWYYAPVRDNFARLHPLMVPWDLLPPLEQRKDLDAVVSIPQLLRDDGIILLDARSPSRATSITAAMDSCTCAPMESNHDSTDWPGLHKLAFDVPTFEVRALIVNKNKREMLTLPHDPTWDLPGSTVAKGERVDRALVQAIAENGIDIKDVVPTSLLYAGSMVSTNVIWLFYEICIDNQDLPPAQKMKTRWISFNPLETLQTAVSDCPQGVGEFLLRWADAANYCLDNTIQKSDFQ